MRNDRVVVMIATALETRALRPLKALGDRIDLIYEPGPPAAPLQLWGAFDDGCHRDGADGERISAPLQRAEVLLGVPGGSAEGLARAVRAGPNLRWIQTLDNDADELTKSVGLSDEELRHVVITDAGGVDATARAEFAMSGLLALTKGLARLFADQRNRRWEPQPVDELDGQTVLVVGLGAVGLEVARLARAFGMRVMGIDLEARSHVQNVTTVRPPRFLADLLQVSHGVVVTLSATEQTRALIDAGAFDLMHSGAVLVNVGDAAVIDEGALIDALADGRLAGAALDAFATEPLPADSPLWGMANVIISPHSAGLSSKRNERIVELFADRLSHYLACESPRLRGGQWNLDGFRERDIGRVQSAQVRTQLPHAFEQTTH